MQDYLLNNDFDSIKPLTSHNGLVIGRWVTKQRVAFKAGKLEQWKLNKLDSLGWVSDPFKQQWNMSFSLLEQFASENESAYVPQSTRIQGVHIGRWVSSQRQDFKAGILTQDRITKLESLKGWMWDASNQSASAISKSGLSPSKLKSIKKE